MAATNAAPFQIRLVDDASWQQEIVETKGIIQVVECHKHWCGPCKAIVSAFRRISLDLGESPIKFYTADVDEIEALSEYRASCKPTFLFYKDCQLLETVAGVNYPELSSQILKLTA